MNSDLSAARRSASTAVAEAATARSGAAQRSATADALQQEAARLAGEAAVLRRALATATAEADRAKRLAAAQHREAENSRADADRSIALAAQVIEQVCWWLVVAKTKREVLCSHLDISCVCVLPAPFLDRIGSTRRR